MDSQRSGRESTLTLKSLHSGMDAGQIRRERIWTRSIPMYVPKQFEESRLDVMHELIRAHPLATLITLSSTGLNANHIPLHLSENGSPFGVLQGHVARANPLWQEFDKDKEILAVFQGPDAYISPSWYATKMETGKVVPTWNYVAVHAYGTLRVVDDSVWIRARLEDVITRLLGKWKVSQNQPPHNQASVMQGLHASNQADLTAMAMLVEAGIKSYRE